MAFWAIEKQELEIRATLVFLCKNIYRHCGRACPELDSGSRNPLIVGGSSLVVMSVVAVVARGFKPLYDDVVFSGIIGQGCMQSLFCEV